MKSPVSVVANFRANSANSRRPSALLRWVLAALAAIALLGSPPAVSTAQAAGAQWYDGMIEYSTITNCVSIIQGDPYLEYGAGTYVGFYANPDSGLPAPNTTYYVHVVVYGLGNSCSGERVWPEIALPANTTIDGSSPIYCYATGVLDTADCPTSLTPSGYHPGAYVILSPDAVNAHTWPLPQGKNWEFQIPVKSTTTLSGSNLTGWVNVLDGNSSPWLVPQEGVYVFGGTPTVFYPSPNTTNIGTTTAKSYGDIYNAHLAGNVWFDLGTTTSYGLVTDGPIPLDTSYTNWEAWDDWQPISGPSPLQPDTLYHYRVRFQVTSSGNWYYGADQTFRTLGGAATLQVSGIASGGAAGTTRSVTVTAKNGLGTTATDYRGTVHFTSSDTAAVLPANYTFTVGDAGVHTFSLGVNLKTAGSQSVSARDTVHSSITGAQTGIVVTPAAATHLIVSGLPSPTVAGVAHNVTVTAKDAYGNTATGYAGTVHLTSSDGAATLPANATLAAGVHTFSVTLKTAGTRSVTATDTVTASITGSQSTIVVTPAPATHLIVSGLPSTYAIGVAHNVTVTAKDAYGNTATGYHGTVHFTSSDPAAVLPANYTFTAGDAGVHTFAVTLKTAGTRSVTATDTVTASITGSQSTIVVTPAPATHLIVSGLPSPTVAGVAHNVTVTARNASGGVAIGYHGTVHFTSSDPAAVLPANYTFTGGDAGVHTFSVTLKTAGTRSVTATDTVTATITGAQVGIVVQAAVVTLTGATYHALTPTRILDSRDGTGGLSGPFSSHVARTFTVRGHGGVPSNATAITGNLTVTGQTSAGFLAIGPVAMNNPTSSTLNFPLNDDRANAVTVALSATGTLSITYAASTFGPTAQVIFDVTGYFTPDATGATYHALTPARVLDSRDGTGGLAGPFSSHVARTFTVRGHGGVPSNATAVTGNLTVTGQTSAGFLAIGPVAMNNPTSSTLNFPLNDDRANAVTVALSSTGTLSITYAAATFGPTAQVIFDVTGYFTPDMTGAKYVPLTPARVLDSRDGTGGLAGPFSSHVARTFVVRGHGGVPSNAIAVTGNLTVTQQTSAGFLFIGPVAMNNPTSSTLNFPLNDDRANAVTAALGGGNLSATYAAATFGPTAQVIFDVTGYFVP